MKRFLLVALALLSLFTLTAEAAFKTPYNSQRWVEFYNVGGYNYGVLDTTGSVSLSFTCAFEADAQWIGLFSAKDGTPAGDASTIVVNGLAYTDWMEASTYRSQEDYRVFWDLLRNAKTITVGKYRFTAAGLNDILPMFNSPDFMCGLKIK